MVIWSIQNAMGGEIFVQNWNYKILDVAEAVDLIVAKRLLE